MKKGILKKGKKFNVKVIIALVTSVVAISAIGIGLGVGLSGGDDKSQASTLTLSGLKTKLENIPNDPIELVDKDAISLATWRDINDDFFTTVIQKPIIKIPSQFEAQYQIAQTLDVLDGDLTIDFRIRKKGDVSWTSVNSYTISVTGITRRTILTNFNAFGQKILDRNSENGLLEVEESDWSDRNNRYFVSPYVEQLPFFSSVKILPLEGEPIKRDGKVTIKFEVTTSNNQITIVSFDFKVGKDTWDAKEILENLNYGEIESENGIPATNDWTNLDEFFTTIGKEKPANLPANSDIQYKIDNPITTNGELVVDFRYRRKDITDDMWTTIPSQYKVQVKVLGN